MSFSYPHPYFKIIQDISRQRNTAVYLIGGFLRNHLLGIVTQDFDFAVAKKSLQLAREFADKIKGAYIVLDKERGCARVVKKIKEEACTFDFSDFRAKTLREDLSHRDFTINTLAVSLKNWHESIAAKNVLPRSSAKGGTDAGDQIGANFDPFDFAQGRPERCQSRDDVSPVPAPPMGGAAGPQGKIVREAPILLDFKKGLPDIRAGRIRMVSSRVFKEDPLRLLRAFSLKAQLNFKIEEKTLRQIKKDRGLLSRVSAERIREELFKILESPRAAANLKSMDQVQLLENAIPQIRVMHDCPQGGYHHLAVWPHSLETVVQLEKVFEELKNNHDLSQYLQAALGGNHHRQALIKLAALLHDIGKPQTKKIEEGRTSFHGHEHAGKNITRKIAKMLKLSNEERFALEDMVLWHLRPGYLSNFTRPSPRSIYRYFRDTKEEAASILLLSLADQRSTRGPLTTQEDQRHHEQICKTLVRKYFKKKKEKPFVRLMSGHDLIKHLRLKPSPLFGKILSAVEEKQILGKITTKQEALKLAKEIVQG